MASAAHTVKAMEPFQGEQFQGESDVLSDWTVRTVSVRTSWFTVRAEFKLLRALCNCLGVVTKAAFIVGVPSGYRARSDTFVSHAQARLDQTTR